jgi:squalene synthase HpnC
VRLLATVRVCKLPREPFARLIEANRFDQRVNRYESFDQLLAYCALSANPVGELVLGVLGLASTERVALSDCVCSALQLAEHWQDVGEDLRRGRIYLPAEDMRSFGVAERDLQAIRAGVGLRELMAFEVGRARELLTEGLPLLRTLHGRPMLAVAGFISGGHAALQAIEGADYEVLARTPSASRPRRVLAFSELLLARRWRSSNAGRAMIRSKSVSH